MSLSGSNKMMLRVIQVWAALVLVLHLSAYWLPVELVWGVWPYTVLPLWLGLLLAVVVGSLLYMPWNGYLGGQLARLWQILPGKHAPNRWFVAISIAALPVFWLLRIRHLGWGDAQILVIGLSHPEQTVIYNWQAPFTVFLHQRSWALFFEPVLGWGVETVYAIFSVLAGGLFVFVALRVAYETGRSAIERILIAGLILTTGTMALFFGYVENYTLISVGIIVYLWLALRVLRGEASLWSAITALALTNAFHPSTVVLWPSAVYLAWRSYRRHGGLLTTLQALIIPPLVVGGMVLTLMELGDHGLAAFLGDDRPGGGDHIWLVPLTLAEPTPWLHYTMFSIAHFIDWGNEMLLISCFGGVIILAATVALLRSGRWRQPIEASGWFLAIATAGYVLLTFLWNADYGIRKDWDLFSPAAIPLTLFAAWLLVRLLPRRQHAAAALIVLGVSALHTATWVLINTQPLF